MGNGLITDVQIREYLLGRLDANSEVSERIDEQTLTDPEFSLNVDIIEDDIIEEYIEGLLNSDDLRSVERYFLRPPERQKKLRNARLLSRHLAEASITNEPTRASSSVVSFPERWQRIQEKLHLRLYAELAGLLIFVISTSYLLHQRGELYAAVKQNNQQLLEERQRSSILNKQLHAALQFSQRSAVMLNLMEPGLRRSMSDLPEATVNASTKILHINVALSSTAASRYQIALRQDEKTFWSSNEEDAIAVPGGSLLRMDIPAEALPKGTCELSVTQEGKSGLSYWFVISKAE